MAAVEVTISGVLYDKTARTMQPVVLIGEASLTGLGVGGGPIPPEPQPPKPPTWGGHPEHPIYYPPIPTHPIVLPPDKPTEPPIDPPIEPPTNPPNVQWSWCWNPNTGWIPAYVAGDKPHPIPPKK